MSEKKTRDTRALSWACVVYPESAPQNWRDIIDGHHIKWVESPLHDQDVYTDEDGTVVKKPHWHLLLTFESKKSFEQIREITDTINAPMPQRAVSARGCVRYMAHLDNPEKHQYDVRGIIAHGGADIAELLRPTSSERYVRIGEMVDYVTKNNITEFCDLLVYARTYRPDDWFTLLCDSCAYIINQHIKSLRFKLERQNAALADRRTSGTHWKDENQ
jgi:hypothetical protein